MDVVTHVTALWRSESQFVEFSLWVYVFPYAGFREAPLGCDDSSGTIVLCHPFHNPYLILCLLFSVTIEPSSRLLPGLRLLAGGISLSMAPSQRQCRVEKVKGGKSRHSHRVSKLHRVTKMSHTDAEIHFSVLHFRETSFFRDTARPFAEQLRFDYLQEADKCAEDGRRKTATLWYTHENSNFKLSDLGFWFSPGLLPTTVEKLQVFTDVFSLFVLVWLCPHCTKHFSFVHLNSSRVLTFDLFISLKSKYSVVSEVHCYLHSIYIYRKLRSNMPYCRFLLAWSKCTVNQYLQINHKQFKLFLFWSLFREVGGSC